MAQQLGAIRFKGKVANVVGFKNSASSKTNNNFVREHQTVISNPKTYAQARQRSKAIPAQNFYATFENVLNHAFLPTDRASRNRNRFISKAMSLVEVPDVMKGDSYIPVCGYQISEGTLGVDYLCELNTEPAGEPYFINLKKVANATDKAQPIHDFVVGILSRNSELSEGQELTFLAILASETDPKDRIATVSSIVLNSSDTITTLGDVSPLLNFGGDVDLVEIMSSLSGYVVMAAGLIISSKSGSTWRYTNSKMYPTQAYQSVVDSLPSADDVIRSYMEGSAGRTSDLILQQADNAQTDGVHPRSVSTMNITLAQGVAGTLSANAANIATMSNGVRKVMVLNGALTTGAAGSRVVITITPTDQPARPLTMADTTFDGNETITVEEVEAYGI